MTKNSPDTRKRTSSSSSSSLLPSNDDEIKDVGGDEEPNHHKTCPPEGYRCNLCDQPGHWIQVCPDRRKYNQKQKRQKKDHSHVPVPGVDPSPADIQAAQKYQQWLAKNVAPTCFCGQPSRLKKVKRNKQKQQQQNSRAIGKYFFFCTKKREDNPCRFAKLADEVIKEHKRKINKANKKDTQNKVVDGKDESEVVDDKE